MQNGVVVVVVVLFVVFNWCWNVAVGPCWVDCSSNWGHVERDYVNKNTKNKISHWFRIIEFLCNFSSDNCLDFSQNIDWELNRLLIIPTSFVAALIDHSATLITMLLMNTNQFSSKCDKYLLQPMWSMFKVQKILQCLQKCVEINSGFISNLLTISRNAAAKEKSWNTYEILVVEFKINGKALKS